MVPNRHGEGDVYSSAFSLSGLVDAGDTYYLTLSDAATANDDAAGWDINHGPSSCVSRILQRQERPGLLGELHALWRPRRPRLTCGPASLTLLGIGCVGLMGYAGLRRWLAAKVVPAA